MAEGMNCPKCKKEMVRLYYDADMGETLYKCRECGIKKWIEENDPSGG